MRHRRVVVTRHGGPEVLQVVEEEAPEPGPGEVRIRVLAAGVSAYDLMFRRSRLLPGTPKPPFSPGEDVVGTVDAVGEGVTGLERGELVAGPTFALGVGGGYAEHVCLPAADLVRLPHGVDPAQSVCLVINYLTAHTALHRVARVRRGERILVHGAAGGVGTALLDLGRLEELEIFGTASKRTHDVVRGFGATPIDYRTEDFVERIRAFTPDGVDVVFDPVGGARHLWRSYRCLRRGGRLAWFGVAAARDRGLRVIPGSLLMRTVLALVPDGRRAPLAPDLSKDGAYIRDTLERLLALLGEGRLEPLVAARVPFADAPRAHELLERGGHAGKVVLVPDA